MHLSVRHSQSLEEGEGPVNPDQSPADMLVLSFTDSDLACMAEAYRREHNVPTLRLTSLARLKHPLSVDLYMEQVAAYAKIIVVRLLGGYEWWRYGAEELGKIAREKNIALAMVPGDGRDDARLTALSTVPETMVAEIDACLAQGGIDNAHAVLQTMRSLVKGPTSMPQQKVIAAGALYRVAGDDQKDGKATLIFYRAHYLAADTAPVDALLEALAQQGITARAFMVTSLKDAAAFAALKADIESDRPDIILDLTAFSAGSEAHPLADANVPVLQCALANSSREAWQESQRGLMTTDLAMHVVLPEADGRVFTRAISFKAESGMDVATEFTTIKHQPESDCIAYVAALAAAWARLAKKAPADKRVALVLSDYPDRAGRSAYAVGLDGPQSAVGILRLLEKDGYTLADIPESGGELLSALRHPRHVQTYSLADYNKRFRALPPEQQTLLTKTWGAPEADAFFRGDAFHLPCITCGHVTIALQPDRGGLLDCKAGYHDANTPPRHGYLAFYWWLRDVMHIDALVHLGTHGNLEWLPGKSVALSPSCWPEIVLGPMPVIYPYIVSDPGEAAQAKRRISAVTLSHLTPPLVPVSVSPELAALETLVDEYSSADGLDARRMKLLREEIIHRARRAGLPGAEADESSLMTALETHLCDIKEQRVGNGLHVFGQAPEAGSGDMMAEALYEIAGGAIAKEAIAARLAESVVSEAESLLAALNGGFIMPSPGGSPVRGRIDILPTGRNMVTIDPRMIPTPTAHMIGKRAAEEFLRRYIQDHGDWPRNIVMDVWGSATLRNGGDEIAQGLYLMGVEPIWDTASHRVTGFEIISDDVLGRPRVDVSLRISGLFRDMFANLITLFDDAAQAVFAADNEKLWRVFGSAPGAYGAGVNGLIDSGRWNVRNELGQAYLEASHFAYGRDANGQAEPAALRERILSADALIHVQDQREMDVLNGADFADAEGGFAAAAEMLGAEPSLYHLDTSQPQKIKARTLAEEISLTLQARALGRSWIEGQMRHGYAGAAAMADVVDQLFAFAATTGAVSAAQFDAVFDCYLHDEKIRNFIAQENPAALQAMAARLDEAIRRGLWTPLRNSAWTLLEALNAKDAAA